MRLYIAGPMSGYPDFNYGLFRDVQRSLELRGYTDILNPIDAELENPTPGTPQAWDWYMRKCIAMILQADGIAVLRDWECSPGARLEVSIAHMLRIPVKPYYAW